MSDRFDGRTQSDEEHVRGLHRQSDSTAGQSRRSGAQVKTCAGLFHTCATGPGRHLNLARATRNFFCSGRVAGRYGIDRSRGFAVDGRQSRNPVGLGAAGGLLHTGRQDAGQIRGHCDHREYDGQERRLKSSGSPAKHRNSTSSTGVVHVSQYTPKKHQKTLIRTPAARFPSSDGAGNRATPTIFRQNSHKN